MIAREIMTSKVYTVSPEASVQEVAQLLTRAHISGVPVVDKDGKILGVITESDIIRKATGEGLHVADIMNPETVVVDEETWIDQIARLLTEHHIKRVPVMHEGKLVGIVCRSDIVQAVAQGFVITRSW